MTGSPSPAPSPSVPHPLTIHQRSAHHPSALVESKLPKHRGLVDQLFHELNTLRPHPAPTPTIRLGFSGAPGVGKSTLIEAFGAHLVDQQKLTLAVLVTFPLSSPSQWLIGMHGRLWIRRRCGPAAPSLATRPECRSCRCTLQPTSGRRRISVTSAASLPRPLIPSVSASVSFSRLARITQRARCRI